MSHVTIAPKLNELQYRVIRSLGSGAGSSILLIADVKTTQQYALKVVKRQGPDDDIYVSQALHEWEVAQRLSHRHLVRIYDCRVKRTWFRTSGVELLMEYVDGKALDELTIKDRGQLMLIFLQVASGLHHMHRRGIYHGDLKPGNIMLTKAGMVKVLDFGTAWIKGQPKYRVQGTPQYMAPEQATERVVDERTDLYNFGATMYRLLTGQYANLGSPTDLNGVYGRHARPNPPAQLDPGIPVPLSELIMACLEIRPDRRPAGGIKEVRQRLTAIAEKMGLLRERSRASDGPGV